jgi:hypothetical protein
LTDLIERHQDFLWRAQGKKFNPSVNPVNTNGAPTAGAGAAPVATIKLSASEAGNATNGTISSAWSFDTVRSISTVGGSSYGSSLREVRDVRHVLNLDPREEDEDEYDEFDHEEAEARHRMEVEKTMAILREQGVVVNDDDDGLFDYEDEATESLSQSDYDTNRAVSGTINRPTISDLGLNSRAAHSTVRIQVCAWRAERSHAVEHLLIMNPSISRTTHFLPPRRRRTWTSRRRILIALQVGQVIAHGRIPMGLPSESQISAMGTSNVYGPSGN